MQMGTSPSPLMPLLLVSILILLDVPFSLSASSPLSPPTGNSPSQRANARNGLHFYRCVDGDWMLASAYATLVDSSSGEEVGNYSFVKNARVPKRGGTWSLLNNPGDHAESGFPYSRVSGKKLYTASPATEDDMPDFLAVASSHAYDGAASMVSYIAQLGTKGGVAPSDGYCETEGELINVPYQAEYQFWKQDLVPPSMPTALAVLTGNPLQGFYGTGVVTYLYDGFKWQQTGVLAAMYDVPGGTQVGSYFIKSVTDYRGGSFCWKVDNPNGFEIVGKPASSPVQVSPDCLPWSLNEVTTSSGNSSMFGPYTYVQMVSTTGGLPPKPKGKKAPKKGASWKSPFSAIYWFYCKGA